MSKNLNLDLLVSLWEKLEPHPLQSAPVHIALIHDWLNQLGGAEDVLETLHGMFPAAPIYTSIYDRAHMPAAWRGWDIRSSWMDRLPGIYRHHQPYMPIFAALWANRQIPPDYDMLLSNKSAFCIGARSRNPSAKHICYCLTPTRFTYDFDGYVARGEKLPPGAGAILRALNIALRRWETQAAQRVTKFIAISREVQTRIRLLYKRESDIIYPPVDLRRTPLDFSQALDDGYYFIVSRLLPYKRIDLAIQAFARLKLPLVIAGDGRDRPRLQALITDLGADNVKLIGRVDDATLADLLGRCRAFVFPGFEDFGIAPIRAMAYGKPVIAFAKGGALDTIVDGVTGTLFNSQTLDDLVVAVGKNSEVRFAPVDIRRHAERFGVDRFMSELSALVVGDWPLAASR